VAALGTSQRRLKDHRSHLAAPAMLDG
jgi:hypothetical protein